VWGFVASAKYLDDEQVYGAGMRLVESEGDIDAEIEQVIRKFGSLKEAEVSRLGWLVVRKARDKRGIIELWCEEIGRCRNEDLILVGLPTIGRVGVGSPIVLSTLRKCRGSSNGAIAAVATEIASTLSGKSGDVKSGDGRK